MFFVLFRFQSDGASQWRVCYQRGLFHNSQLPPYIILAIRLSLQTNRFLPKKGVLSTGLPCKSWKYQQTKKTILVHRNTTSSPHIFISPTFINHNHLPNDLDSAIFTFLKGNFYRRHIYKVSARWQTFLFYLKKMQYTYFCVWHNVNIWELKNKPAAQAAGADPSWWSSTNGQNPPIQQNCRNFWTSNAIWMPFGI